VQAARQFIELDHRVDLRRTVAPIRHGPGDPTVRFAADGVWTAFRTPAGPATVRLACAVEGRCDVVEADAWGPGSEWALARAPGMVGACDRIDGFDPSRHPVVDRLAREMSNLRMVRTGRVFDALVPAILEQKVTSTEAHRAWASLVRRYGMAAPGPVPTLRVAPSPRALARLGSFHLHPLGVERRRADCIRRAATVSQRLEGAVDSGSRALGLRLRSLHGIGPWTEAETVSVALGDPDAVSVGDFHLPHLVAWALAGEPRADDDRMLELLDPFAGHRGRVVRLIELSGIGYPRHGPRMRLRDIQRS
jgi:3-methyladenine DNA glycosylase/8-oxoguanine DNA glycosylase